LQISFFSLHSNFSFVLAQVMGLSTIAVAVVAVAVVAVAVVAVAVVAVAVVAVAVVAVAVVAVSVFFTPFLLFYFSFVLAQAMGSILNPSHDVHYKMQSKYY
jgi:hypothetical protein